ncbi:glycoside hydrolase family 3 N-terminal domain-containing protein [Microbacterium betulae]|uniref:Glycoside hydrolase family 3 N-terminal domain-containing protein n=1 Tax=Microbacterium betulae TaxID=2981139 RepID=A0AA97FIB0_9MICO|nr:glycoside hydrolase family 3 N-terminal domain-containing protein [Microbacterium sp. AB]WOF23560.1 glycoside hydrolase family 3 N-terminal domain-containing protein [Microbacterium sp. AB]
MGSAKTRRPMSNRTFLAIWIPVVAFVAIVAVGANVAIGMFRGAIESYMGTGTYVVSNTAEGEQLDTTYNEAGYATEGEAKAASAELVEDIADEGMTLLKNNGALPLGTGAVTLLGRGAADPVYGGSGSGTADTRTAVDIRRGLENAGFTVNDTVYEELAAFAEANPASEGGRTNIVMDKPEESNYDIGEMPVSDYSQDALDSFAEYGDAGVVVIGRGGGEGGDLATNMEAWDDNAEPGQHQLELNQDEKDLVALAAESFETVVVVINASTSMELGVLEDAPAVDGIVLAGSPGVTGFNALGGILSGAVNPSGHTVDVFSRDFTADPSFVNFGDFSYSNLDEAYFVDYEEGIYSGYRYYETAAVEGFVDYDDAVVYPFGYGLSYTTFDWAVTDSETGAVDGEISVDVEVANTGDVAGQDVVQLYYTAPYTPGGIEKAHVVLGDFAKTAVIEPGASETVTVTIAVEDMASYDSADAAAYVLEEGDYEITLQTDSHTPKDGVDPIVYTVDETVAYSDGRASDADAATNRFDDVTAEFTEGRRTEFSRADFAGTFPTAPEGDDLVASEATVAAYEPFDASVLADEDAEEPTWGADGDVSLVDLRGLAYDDPAWEELLDRLELDEVLTMLNSGAYNTAAFPEIGKIRTNDLDGPAGFSSFINPELWTGTAFPSEYLIGQTWSRDLAERMGVAIGDEALTMGANGWYAPAVNLHRSPFAGRNFEYYSEDPVLSGALATQVVDGALTKGVYSFTKHFAMNDQETNRVNGDGLSTWATEQTIRELYLKPFETVVKDASGEVEYYDADGVLQTTEIGSTAIMSSFNRIGATWAGGSEALMHDVLRGEWGFEGFAITDFNLYGYMYPDQAWDARGTDLMLTFEGSKTIEDTASPAAQENLRYAAHNILYTVANSNAVNGMASGATLSYQLAGWEIGVIAGTVLLALLVVAGVIWIIVRVRRHRAHPSIAAAGAESY